MDFFFFGQNIFTGLGDSYFISYYLLQLDRSSIGDSYRIGDYLYYKHPGQAK